MGHCNACAPSWHHALLNEMALELENVRPAVLGPATLVHLRRLLAFRHFFRHAYSAELDAARLEELQRVAAAASPLLSADAAALDVFLRTLLSPAK